MKELQGQRHFGGIETGARFVKLAHSLYLKHEVAAVDVLHDKEQAILFFRQANENGLQTVQMKCAGAEIAESFSDLGLKARVKSREKGVLGREGQNALLRHGTLHVVVLQDHVLLQHLDCVDFLGALQLGQHHLSKTALAQDFDKVELAQPHLLASARRTVHESVKGRRRLAGRFARVLHFLVQLLVHSVLGQDPQLHLFFLVRPAGAVSVAALGTRSRF